MLNPKFIKNKITSVGKIKKIANALEIVALTRLRRMEEKTFASRSYFDEIRKVLFGMAGSINFKFHPFLEERRPVRTVGIIAIFSDKGLCGNFNANAADKFFEFAKRHKGRKIKAVTIGKKGERYVRKSALCEAAGTDPQIFIEGFLKKDIDEIYLLYNRFRLHLLGEVKIIKLLPFVRGGEVEAERKHLTRDYIYEPGAYAVFEALSREYIANQIHHGALESKCAEEMSRMLAMKLANENAEEMIAKLHLAYNKNRQAAITRELTEVVAAAEAA